MAADEILFSYGTLRYPQVQRERFGRLLDGEPDALTGFEVISVAIEDADVVRASGESHHPGLVARPDATHEIDGIAFRVTSAELDAADEYEARHYIRRRVGLRSGRAAWAYVVAADGQGE